MSWYLATAFGRWEGPGVRPFYADATKVGRFAVDLGAVEARDPDALFQVLVTLAAYQSRRDVDIMAIQRAMPVRQATAMIAPQRLRVLVEGSRCPNLRDAAGAMCVATSRGAARRATHVRGPRVM